MQPTGVLETSKATNPLRALLSYGQSMWLDYIRRDLITSGSLKKMIADDGLRGMTSNPAIFEKAIAESSLYDDLLKALASRTDLDTKARYEQIAIRDIQDAADVLRPVYESSKFGDGYVSLEVSPLLALKTQETIDEARRLWKAVNRENVMIKIPGTAEGLPAIRQAIGEGINVNVTLLFAQEVYEKVAEAHIAGLEDLAKRGGNLKKIGGVASFFHQPHRLAGRLDDQRETENRSDAQQQALLKSLLGKVAIANGKLTYLRYQRLFNGPRWQTLAAQGAQTQRVLWASTSTKNPAYRDVMYVEELIGPDTVNTMPPATIDAFRDHGKSTKQPDRGCGGRAERDGQSGESRHLDQRSDYQADG